VTAGRGRFVRELLTAFAACEEEGVRYVCYARERWGELPSSHFRWSLHGAADPWWHMLVARAASHECDVFLSTNSYLTTWFVRIPAVPVIYDMVAFDRAHQPNRRSALIERATLGISVRRSRAFIAISRSTADDFEHRFPRVAGRITVAPLAVAPQLAPSEQPPEQASTPATRLPEAGFVLAVGTLEPRKNLPRLVEAYRLLPEAVQREHPLVVVGDLGWRTDATLTALASLGNRCTVLGKVPDATLAELYRRCAMFCYPSLYEGFGLPVLEAMAAGAAVLTSNVSSLPEVGGDAVAYVDPLDVAAIAAALSELLSDPQRRATLGAAARARAGEFSWERTAATVLGTLRALAT
jgi:glycosyltransferase involved in cell wall biosynthesis